MLPGWEEKNVKTNLLMQDKDKMPDVLWFNGMGKEYTQWVEAGLLVDLIPLLKNTKDKNILKKMTAEMLFPYYKDGKLYRIPTDIGGNGCCMTTYVRKDWLDKLGLEVPKTVDDFIKVARAFTKMTRMVTAKTILMVLVDKIQEELTGELFHQYFMPMVMHRTFSVCIKTVL